LSFISAPQGDFVAGFGIGVGSDFADFSMDFYGDLMEQW
jgi:hypothetical protein